MPGERVGEGGGVAAHLGESEADRVRDIRRAGWTPHLVHRAATRLEGESALAKELRRWLVAASDPDGPDEVAAWRSRHQTRLADDLNALARARVPPVPEELEPLAHILSGPGLERQHRLQQAYVDPVASLRLLLADEGGAPLDQSAATAMRTLHGAALVALAEIGSLEACGAIFEYLARREGEQSEGPVRAALALVAPSQLVESVTTAWGGLDWYQRAIAAEILSARRLRDERVYQHLVTWLKEDANEAVIALAEYGDARAVPLLTALLNSCFESNEDVRLILEIAHALERDFEMKLTPRQRARVDAAVAGAKPSD